VPLSKQAIKVLQSPEQVTGPEGLIFKSIRTSSGYISNNTLNMALKRMGFDGRMCGHGFRALALTNIQECLKIDLRVVDRQLAHIEKNKVTATYNRAEYWEEREAMMQQWADLVDAQKQASKKRGVIPVLLKPVQQSIFECLMPPKPQGVVPVDSVSERCPQRCGRR
jgi:hypothetical protein